MGSFRLDIKRSVHSDLKRIPKELIPRVLQQIEGLAEDPFPRQSRKLVASESTYRLRVGAYRVIYTIDVDQRLVEVYHVRHRREVYR